MGRRQQGTEWSISHVRGPTAYSLRCIHTPQKVIFGIYYISGTYKYIVCSRIGSRTALRKRDKWVKEVL